MKKSKKLRGRTAVILAAACLFAVVVSGCQREQQAEPGSIAAQQSAADQPEHMLTEQSQGQENTVVSAQIQSAEDTTPQSEVQPVETSPAAPARLRLVAVGDNLMHRSVSLSGQQPDGSWNFARNFEHVAPVASQADIAVINQEAVMGGLVLGIQNYPSLNTCQEVGPYIVNAGFDVILGANNHILDQGFVGVQNMMTYWKTYFPQIHLLGINQNEQERDVVTVIERSGIKVALLNYTYDTNMHDALQNRPYLVNFLNKDQMAADIAKAKKEADFIVVFPHWGEEYSFAEKNAEQDELTQFFAEQGVDLVIGAHPHVLQPVQWIRRTADRPMLVYYSLGNFQSIQYRTDTMLGGLADVTIVKDQSGTYIADHKLDFLVTHYQNTIPGAGYFDYVTTFCWDEYTPELAAQHGILAEDPSFSYEALAALRQQILAVME